MPEFVIFLHRVPGTPPFGPELVREHCLHLATLARTGRLIAAGPFSDEKDGGFYAATFDSAGDASRFAACDPFVREKIETTEVRPWVSARLETGLLGVLPPEPAPQPAFLDALRLRATTYSFADRPVEEDLVRSLLSAALAAPSEFNLQPWRPVVCRGQEDLKRLERCCFGQSQVSAAGLAVICAVDPKVFHDEAPRAADDLIAAGRWPAAERESRIEFIRSRYANTLVSSLRNGTIFGHQLLLAAFSQGLGGFWLGGFDEQALRDEFRIPPRVRVAGIVGLGWPAGPASPLRRRSLDELVSFGDWREPEA